MAAWLSLCYRRALFENPRGYALLLHHCLHVDRLPRFGDDVARLLAWLAGTRPLAVDGRFGLAHSHERRIVARAGIGVVRGIAAEDHHRLRLHGRRAEFAGGFDSYSITVDVPIVLRAHLLGHTHTELAHLGLHRVVETHRGEMLLVALLGAGAQDFPETGFEHRKIGREAVKSGATRAAQPGEGEIRGETR